MNRLLLVVVLLVLLAAACASEPADTEQRDASQVSSDRGHAVAEHGHAAAEAEPTAAEPTAAERAAADRLLADTTAALSRFGDLAAAKAEGYQAVTPESLPIVHYAHPDYARNGEVLDPEHPESLVYAHAGERSVLLGAMFLMPEPGMPGPQIGGPLTVWHTHDDLCIDVAREMVVGFVDADGGCPGGAINEETPEMLHVWIVDHPDGPFAHDMSPAVLLPHALS